MESLASQQQERLERVIELAQCLIDDIGIVETDIDHTKHALWLHTIKNAVDLCIQENRNGQIPLEEGLVC